ncbi:MAG: hypothetical protein HY335_06555, partial [Deinococcus sp.]|nr:hypothetical protein [Deinococcus sp.]
MLKGIAQTRVVWPLAALLVSLASCTPMNPVVPAPGLGDVVQIPVNDDGDASFNLQGVNAGEGYLFVVSASSLVPGSTPFSLTGGTAADRLALRDATAAASRPLPRRVLSELLAHQMLEERWQRLLAGQIPPHRRSGRLGDPEGDANVGDEANFIVFEERTFVLRAKEANISGSGHGARLWVQEGLANSSLSNAEINAFADRLFDISFARNVEAFGEPSDVDDNGFVEFLLSNDINLAPYFGFFDERNSLNAASNPDSNEADAVFSVVPDEDGTLFGGGVYGLPSIDATLIHELQHLINFNQKTLRRITGGVNRTITGAEFNQIGSSFPHETGQVNEGLSVFSEDFGGSGVSDPANPRYLAFDFLSDTGARGLFAGGDD